MKSKLASRALILLALAAELTAMPSPSAAALPLRHCVGGVNDGALCENTLTDCPNKCVGGPGDGSVCINVINCPQGCVGGPRDGLGCNFDSDCSGGDCTAECETGTCLPDGTGGMGGGSSKGDPHLQTPDGTTYDFQGAGEFILFSSEKLTIQVRQTPLSSGAPAAVITAVAIGLGPDRIGLYVACPSGPGPTLKSVVAPDGSQTTEPGAESCSHDLRFNGEPKFVAPGELLDLPEGSSLRQTGSSYRVATNGDLTGASVDLGPYYLNVSVWNYDSLYPGSGLLRDGNGERNDDIVVRNGPALYPPILFTDLYGIFGESWRVTAAESLFDYAAGESTETFTDRNFPPFRMDVGLLPESQRASAESVCSAAGLSQGYWFDSCVLDVAITGDSRFAQGLPRNTDGTVSLQIVSDPASESLGNQWAADTREAAESRNWNDRSEADCHCSTPGKTRDSGYTAWASITLGILLIRRLRVRRATLAA